MHITRLNKRETVVGLTWFRYRLNWSLSSSSRADDFHHDNRLSRAALLSLVPYFFSRTASLVGCRFCLSHYRATASFRSPMLSSGTNNFNYNYAFMVLLEVLNFDSSKRLNLSPLIISNPTHNSGPQAHSAKNPSIT